MSATKPLGRPPGSDGQVTRASLLAAGRVLFGTLGYERVTPAAVTEKAGLSRTSFYNYWRTKADLYRAVIEDVDTRILQKMFGQAAAEIEDPLDRIAWVFKESARLHADDPSIGRFLSTMLVDGFRNPEFAATAVDGVQRTQLFFQGATSEAQAAGRLATDLDVEAATELLVGLQWGLGLSAAFMGGEERLDRASDLLERILRGGDVRPR